MLRECWVNVELDDNNTIMRVVASKGKLKILRLLLHEGQANITKIVRETGLHYNLALKHLDELKKLNIVEEVRVGRLRMFSLKFDNPQVLTLIEILRALEEAG
jgi:DNA-binding transcriptional ArsR family regulator